MSNGKITEYEIGAKYLPDGEFDLSSDSISTHVFTSLGEVALQSYSPGDTSEGNERFAKIKENLEIDLHTANTIIEIRRPGEGSDLGEILGYISGKHYSMPLEENNPLEKDTLDIFKVYSVVVVPELQSKGAGQILINEILDMVNVDILMGETNNPVAVLARLKAADSESTTWAVVWGHNTELKGKDVDIAKLDYVKQTMFAETLSKRDQDVIDLDLAPADHDLFLREGIINAPDFTGTNDFDPAIAAHLPETLRKTYERMAELSKENSDTTYQAPLYSINMALLKI